MTILWNRNNEIAIKYTDTANVSLLTANTGIYQNVASLNIAELYWSGDWSVARRGTTILDLSGTGNMPLRQRGILIHQDSDPTSNVVFTLNSGTGTIIAKIRKTANNIYHEG